MGGGGACVNRERLQHYIHYVGYNMVNVYWMFWYNEIINFFCEFAVCVLCVLENKYL